METKKHIINLPENKVVENISVKTENGQIIVNYDLKDGDFLADEDGNVFIYNSESISKDTFGCYCGTYDDGVAICLSKSLNWTFKEGCRYATDSEKQDFLKRLEESGYIWNSEKKCLEEYTWKPEYGEEFYYIGSDLVIYLLSRGKYTHHDLLIEANNCFRTRESAERKAEELREVLRTHDTRS